MRKSYGLVGITIFVLILSISISYLQTDNVNAEAVTVLDEKRVSNDLGISSAIEKKLSDKTYIQTINGTELIDSGNGVFVDRLIQGNGTHFNVFSTFGSLSYDKSSCKITFYNYGVNPTAQNFSPSNDDILVESMYWSLEHDGNFVQIDNFDCTITTFQNATGKYLESQREHTSGSYFKTTIASPIGKAFEDLVEFYNNIASWNNDLIAFVQVWDGVKGNSLFIKNGTDLSSLATGNYSLNRQQVIDSGLGKSIIELSDGNNPFHIDLEKAKADFGRLDIEIRSDGRVNLKFVFDNNIQPMPVDSKIFLDPEYSIKKKSKDSKIQNIELDTIDDGSRISNGNVTLSMLGNDTDMCKLYLVNDYINSEAVTDEFMCSGNQSVPLNERGTHIFSAKISDKKAEFEVRKSDSTVINVDEEKFVLDVKFKKPQYFAKIENNFVTNVIVADDDFISRQSGMWVETFIDESERANYAGIGYTYDGVNDVFISPKPSDSAVLNSTTWKWEEP